MVQKETKIKEPNSIGHNSRSLIDPIQLSDVVGIIETNIIHCMSGIITRLVYWYVVIIKITVLT